MAALSRSFILFYGDGDYESEIARMILEEKNIAYTLKHYNVADGANYRKNQQYSGIVPCVYDPHTHQYIICLKNIADHFDIHYSPAGQVLYHAYSGSFIQEQENCLEALEGIRVHLLEYICVYYPEYTTQRISAAEKQKLSNRLENLPRWIKGHHSKKHLLLQDRLLRMAEADKLDIRNPSRVEEAVQSLVSVIEYFEDKLSEGHGAFLLDDSVKLCDLYFSCILQRLDHLGFYGFIFYANRYPHVISYFHRMKRQRSFLNTFSHDDFMDDSMTILKKFLRLPHLVIAAILILGIFCFYFWNCWM